AKEDAPPALPPEEGVTTDIYISYAHLDNQKLSGERYGWVDRFHETLELQLAKLLGREGQVKIWRDAKLRGGDDFSAATASQIAASRLFIPILSPAYVQSPYYLRELKEISGVAKKQV